jgi:hypothetical protein
MLWVWISMCVRVGSDLSLCRGITDLTNVTGTKHFLWKGVLTSKENDNSTTRTFVPIDTQALSDEAAYSHARAYVNEAKEASLRWIKELKELEPDTPWNFDKEFQEFAHAATIAHGLHALEGLNNSGLEKALRDAALRTAVHWAGLSSELVAVMVALSEDTASTKAIDDSGEESARRLVEAILNGTNHSLEAPNDSPSQITRRMRHVMFHHEAIMCWKNIEPTDEEVQKWEELERKVDKMIEEKEVADVTPTPWYIWMIAGGLLFWVISKL